MDSCPCGSNHSYTACCGRFILAQQKPATPEELMRSRYTAYTQVNMDYLVRTMKVPALNRFNVQEAAAWARTIQWLGLEVLHSEMENKHGLVEFKAHYSYQGQKQYLHEMSEFCLEQGQWYYFDGKMSRPVPSTQRKQSISRNDPCPCGSGKKYKKCCLSG